ncbi:hypothetical protein RCS94_06990 [Orbaceae bacterium ac157xtp]
MFKKISALWIAFGLIFSPLAFCEENSTIIHGPFGINWCKNGKFYFEETNNLDYPINFVLECDNVTRIVDQYASDGANILHFSNRKFDIEIESVFFQKVQSKRNLFIIVKRRTTHKAERINADDYDIYVYEYHPQKIITLNNKLMEDINLNGSEGEVGGEEVYFKYKTDAEVKKYINETYN